RVLGPVRASNQRKHRPGFGAMNHRHRYAQCSITRRRHLDRTRRFLATSRLRRADGKCLAILRDASANKHNRESPNSYEAFHDHQSPIEKLASPSAVGHAHWTGVEELLGSHYSVFLEDGPILHYKLNVSQRIDIGERIALTRDHIREHARFDWPAFFDNVRGLIPVNRQGIQNVAVRNVSCLPRIEESYGHVAACQPLTSLRIFHAFIPVIE